jgi:hypothetical protein
VRAPRNEVTQAYPAPPPVSLAPSPPISLSAPLPSPSRTHSAENEFLRASSGPNARLYEDVASPEKAFPSIDDADATGDVDFVPAPRWRRVHWVLLFLVIGTGGAFLVDRIRPDVTDRLAAAFRGDAPPSPSGFSVGSTAPTAPVAANARMAPAKVSPIANPEPPLVSVWSLPVARAGLPAAPPQAFRMPVAPAPARAPLFVPSVSFASSYAATMPNVAATPVVAAPAPPVAPVPTNIAPPKGSPAPIAAATPASDPTPAGAPAPTAAPVRKDPPAPPPVKKFAPGSLEDQIQKAVEAESQKKH